MNLPGAGLRPHQSGGDASAHCRKGSTVSIPQEAQLPAQPELPDQPPATKDRKWVWIILGVIAAFLVLVAIGAIVQLNKAGGASNQAKGLAENFTKLVIAGESDKAYDFLDPKLHEQLSEEDFIAGVHSLKLNDSCQPTYEEPKVNSEGGTNIADVAGVITCDGKAVELVYGFQGTDELKIINIELIPKV